MPTRFWAILAVAFGVSLSVIDGAIANVALPTMARMLGISSANSIWIVNAYQLAIVVSLLSFSALGDVIGYRKIYIGGTGYLHRRLTGLHVVRLSRHAGHGPRLPGIRGGSHHERQYHADPPDIPPAGTWDAEWGVNATVVAVSSVAGPTLLRAFSPSPPGPGFSLSTSRSDSSRVC